MHASAYYACYDTSMKPPLEKKRRLRTMDDLPLDGKRVLVRVDFNVSIGADGRVDETEDYRIESALPTIEELRQRRCKVLLLTHLGRPLADGGDSSVTPVRHRLEELLKDTVREAHSLYGEDVEAIASSLEPGAVMMLPNVRTDEREEQGNTRFAQQLASRADAYVNEAFSVSHRAHTSVAFVPHELMSCAGRRTVMEVERLGKLRDKPEHPYVAIISGAKIQTKIGMLHRLLERVDTLCIGGHLANTFLAALGHYPVDHFSADDIAAAKHLLESDSKKILLPVDFVVSEDESGGGARVMALKDIPQDAKCVCDIGPQSTELFLKACQTAKTVLWNGPVGRFEVPAFADATLKIAEQLSTMPGFRVVGGGDTVNALEQAHVLRKYDHVSVGGGAMISFMEGARLPGLDPLYE